MEGINAFSSIPFPSSLKRPSVFYLAYIKIMQFPLPFYIQRHLRTRKTLCSLPFVERAKHDIFRVSLFFCSFFFVIFLSFFCLSRREKKSCFVLLFKSSYLISSRRKFHAVSVAGRLSFFSSFPSFSINLSLFRPLLCLCGYLILHMWKKTTNKRTTATNNNRVVK
jgi:hypothetical protein